MSDRQDMFKKLAQQRQQKPEPAASSASPEAEAPKKRGRPAVGKRSNPDWIGRTYYVRRETDLDVAAELLELKRQGLDIDKSDLVDALLAAWVKWRNGDNIDCRLGEFSPRRNSEES